MPPFFMATTITIDGTTASNTWQDDQVLDPATDVDLFTLTPDLTGGYPESSPPTETQAGAASTDTVTKTKAKK